mmetsp:Transcript_15369/g.39112  ORF Transcript_15369/g.39112 Transcript_15369/m.39112 type:complete len:369 (+) Transcript_15369:390-1496(+)
MESGKKPVIRGQAPGATDFANYFSLYGHLFHQKEMLEDSVRMEAYQSAILGNEINFSGKTVLDVGTGSGVLAVFAAQAGAKHVYAVEATDAAKFAQSVVTSCNLGHKITVIQGLVETISLPEKVDIIVSEWMGCFLLRESMLDSLLDARDRFLKPDGALYPSHASMYIAPAKCVEKSRQLAEYHNAMSEWYTFTEDAKSAYKMNFECLAKTFEMEVNNHLLRTAHNLDLDPEDLLGPPCCIKEIDLLRATRKDVESVSSDFNMQISHESSEGAEMSAFVGWFDVKFNGSPHNPSLVEAEFSTAPHEDWSTHWGQQGFLVHPSFTVCDGDNVFGHIEMTRKPANPRLYDVSVTYRHGIGPEQRCTYNLD